MIANPRIKLLIARHGRPAAIALFVAAGLAFVLAGWIVLNPPTSTVTETTDEQTIETEVDTSAPLAEDNGLWNETELRNNPVYLTNASPTLVIEPETTVTGAESGTVTHELVLELEAARSGEVFWSRSETKIDETARLSDGAVDSSAELDVRALIGRLAEIRERLAGVGSLEATLHLTTHYETDRYEGTLTDSTELRVSNRAYWLEENLAVSDERSTSTPVTVEQSPNWEAVGLAAALGLLFASGAVAIVSTRPEEMDIEAIEQEIHRRRYADWISTGTIPMWVGEHYLELDTLEDVVDVAIDTQERVVHDRRREIFAVISGTVVYYYSKSGDWDQSSWPELNLPSPEQGPDTPVDVGDGLAGDGDDGDGLRGDSDVGSSSTVGGSEAGTDVDGGGGVNVSPGGDPEPDPDDEPDFENWSEQDWQVGDE